jgi:hypothetical protein
MDMITEGFKIIGMAVVGMLAAYLLGACLFAWWIHRSRKGH